MFSNINVVNCVFFSKIDNKKKVKIDNKHKTIATKMSTTMLSISSTSLNNKKRTRDLLLLDNGSDCPNKKEIKSVTNQNNDISFDSLQFSFYLTKTLVVENDSQKYIERLPNCLIKLFSKLFIEQQQQSRTSFIQINLSSVVQNVDLQVDSKRLGASDTDKHYRDFQYILPLDETISIQWKDYKVQVKIQTPEKSSSKPEDQQGDSGPMNIVKELVGKMTSTMTMTFEPRITSTVFEALCHEATEYVYQQNAKNDPFTKIYVGSDEFGSWELLKTTKKRPWDSVCLPLDIKNDFLKDVKEFLTNRSFYEKLGARYKRVYLFTGIPGSGKSSLIEAAAAELNLSLCYLNASGQTDNGRLCRLMTELKNDSLVIIEDIDTLGLAQADNRENQTQVTYSYLLNLLDGSMCPDGAIFILTCNERNSLGDALMRFGRVDRVFKFDYIKESEIKQMFTYILPSELHSQCDDFVERIGGLCSKLTPSLLREFLLSICFEFPNGQVNIMKQIPKLKKLIKSAEKTQSEITQGMMS